MMQTTIVVLVAIAPDLNLDTYSALNLRSRSSSSHGVIQNQDENSTNHSDKQAVQVYARDAVGTEHAEQPAPNYRTNDSQHDIKDDALARLIYQLAAYETSNQAQHNPCQNRHNLSPSFGSASSK
jgi:hypothetical protein